jgi:hypothetical protein
VPVTVLDDHDTPMSYWVSDADGLVRIPQADWPRLRLRVGLRSEEPIELDTRQLGDATVPLAAARRAQPVAAQRGPVDPTLAPPNQSLHPGGAPPHVLRFTRVGVFGSRVQESGSPVDLAEFHGAEAGAGVRYGVLLETEALWQSLGTESGDLLYSVSLSPGDEARAVVMDGRWRRQSQRERPLQIVAKMIGTQLIGDKQDAVPLEPCALGDLARTAAETVAFLADRTVRVCASLRRRPLGVSEFVGEPVEGGAVRTVRNQQADAVVTYHFVEPLERYRVVVRRPQARPAILVPFRLPNLATREVVEQFGHVLKRTLLDRALVPDLEAVIADGPTAGAAAHRFFAHVSANLPYYSATIIAAGDPTQRQLALAKLHDAAGRVLTDLIENTVVGRVGNYVAFPLRSSEALPAQWRSVLRDDAARLERLSEDLVVLLPIPGVWIKAESTMPLAPGGQDAADGTADVRDWRTRRLRGG